MSHRRIVFVHAHPDDETVGTGATMAHYAADPDTRVTLVTCTLGEEGEVGVPELAGLGADTADQLGGYRLTELRDACAALGVTDYRLLGGVGAYRDSGMMGLPANEHPRALWRAEPAEPAEHLVAILRELRPQVLVTYDPNGFYGHPDHIQAHRISTLAVRLAADPAFRPQLGEPHAVAKLYWTTVPKSALAASFERFRDSGDNPFGDVSDVSELPFGVADDEVTTLIDAPAAGEPKLAAMRAHATQIPRDSWLYVLAAELDSDWLSREHYILAEGRRGPGVGPHNWEADLFAGLDTNA